MIETPNAQDLMTLRDAAEELGDIDLAAELNEVGDKLADQLKEDLDTKQMGPTYVTAYEVTRHFGGPEEGGWWYDWYEPINTVPTSDPAAVVEEFKARYEYRAEGDRFSVLGGTAVFVIIEDEPAEHRSTERPHYS